ncbi:ComEC/Rec2 family competence protein [Clostridium fermenticellae]|uniref:ComEC/Rec2 family competence protein n=1 Tax=Clostridium fermenticellae TaxID=2068654 RepID=UPI0018F87681|nr:MBL fold metallo-hydrolase [Clostridium fermenticellae]
MVKKKIFIFLMLFILIGDTVYAKHGEYGVHFLDTGQSDCILIKADDKNYIIDTGASYYTNKIIRYLKELKIDNIDGVILTHYHDDHYGGLIKIVDNIKVNNVFLPKHYNEVKDDICKELNQRNINIKYIDKNSAFKYKRMKLKFLLPDKVNRRNENNNSVMICGEIDNINYLFAADCEKEEERFMTKKNKLEKCDVLKVPHHALNTSSTNEFLEKIDPKIAIVTSNGVETPDMRVINRISRRGIMVVRTDIYGNIVISKHNLTTGNGRVNIQF